MVIATELRIDDANNLQAEECRNSPTHGRPETSKSIVTAACVLCRVKDNNQYVELAVRDAGETPWVRTVLLQTSQILARWKSVG